MAGAATPACVPSDAEGFLLLKCGIVGLLQISHGASPHTPAGIGDTGESGRPVSPFAVKFRSIVWRDFFC